MADPFALDPLSTVVRLALLGHMSPGVKIGIVHNTIVFHEMNIWDRLWRTGASLVHPGCSKHSLFHLKIPVERAVVWYYHKCPEIFRMALEGLAALSRSYDSDPADGNVTATIGLIAKILESPDKVIPESLEGKPALVELRNAWSDDEINAINATLALLRSQPRRHSVVSAVAVLVQGKDPELFRIIRASPLDRRDDDLPDE